MSSNPDEVHVYFQVAHLFITPDDNRKAVFNCGINNGLNEKILIGGHKDSILIVGDKLLLGGKKLKRIK